MAESVADLENLYNVDATFEYTSRSGLARALDSFCDRAFLDSTSFLLDHTVLVTRFPPQMFELESEDVDNPLPHKGKVLYFPDSHILIFTMPQCPHEVVPDVMNGLLWGKIDKMNCLEEFTPTGRATAMLQNLRKEPDGSWGPQAVNYPTCVLEVCVSESLRQLDCDAQRWIENELSHVTQVVTVKIYPYRYEMIFAIWRRIASRQAEKNDEIHVELRDGRPRVRNNRCLRLLFEQIFERPSTRGTAERDIVFSARDLSIIARKVWQGMGLIPVA